MDAFESRMDRLRRELRSLELEVTSEVEVRLAESLARLRVEEQLKLDGRIGDNSAKMLAEAYAFSWTEKVRQLDWLRIEIYLMEVAHTNILATFQRFSDPQALPASLIPQGG